MADGGLFATATNSMYPFAGNLAMAGRDTLYSNNPIDRSFHMLVEWKYALIKAKLDIYTWFVYQNVDNVNTRKYEIQHYERKFVSDLKQVGGLFS
jgi:hypothetical protein